MPAIIQDSPVLARCEVLYIGSAVPLEATKGLEALQQPLRERYPADNEAELEGIDTVLTITNTNIELLFVSDPSQVIHFPISSMTICAAVRCVINQNAGDNAVQFASLNSPLANAPANARRPAIFSTIVRRSQGRKVLECHSFICRSARDALNLVKMTSYAGNRLKGRQTLPASFERPIPSQRPGSNVYVNGINRASVNRVSNIRNSTIDGNAPQVSNMHLTPAEPIVQNIKPGREFFEPVNTQGYFYSSDKTNVKKFHIENVMGNQNGSAVGATVAPAPAPAEAAPTSPIAIETQSLPPPSVGNGSAAPSPRPQPPTQPQVIYVQNGAPPGPVPVMMGPRPPVMVRMPMRPMMRPGPPPFVYGPPPPPPPMIIRPRFFSPPPPRMRPMPYGVPAVPPQGPIMAPPVFVRRPPRRHSSSSSSSESGSRSRSGSRRSNSPKENDENTEPKRPDADSSSSSEDDLPNRPGTPPKDYEKLNGKRLSRREEFEMKERFRRHQPQMDGPYGPPPGVLREAPRNYDYYVYPPRHGGYEPFMMYNPHLRSRSVPPPMGYRSKSPKKRSKKKHKKPKKDKKRRGLPRTDNISEDSYAGYHSEIPLRQREPEDGSYMIYPPRDFRRADRQFMNERHFSKSIKEEGRRPVDPGPRYPTAYELNETAAKPGEPDFTMY